MGTHRSAPSRSSSSTRSRSRRPRASETDAILAFAAHANSCRPCSDPNRTARHGGQLCEIGMRLAADLAGRLMWCQAEKKYYAQGSARDHGGFGDVDAVEVIFPPGCQAAESLLRAIDNHLITVRRLEPPPSIDSNYYIAPRRPPRRRMPRDDSDDDDYHLPSRYPPSSFPQRYPRQPPRRLVPPPPPAPEAPRRRYREPSPPSPGSMISGSSSRARRSAAGVSERDPWDSLPSSGSRRRAGMG